MRVRAALPSFAAFLRRPAAMALAVMAVMVEAARLTVQLRIAKRRFPANRETSCLRL